MVASGGDGGAVALGAEHLLHRPALRELVDELVEVADPAHEGVLDLLHLDAADGPGDEGGVGGEGCVLPRFLGLATLAMVGSCVGCGRSLQPAAGVAVTKSCRVREVVDRGRGRGSRQRLAAERAAGWAL